MQEMDIQQACDAVTLFSRDTLKWYARRGSRNQRAAARLVADRLPRLVERVRRDLERAAGANAGTSDLPPAA